MILAQQEEIEQLRAKLTALATELANLRQNGSAAAPMAPPSPPPSTTRCSIRQRVAKTVAESGAGQEGHPGAGPALLQMEHFDEVVEHNPVAYRPCSTLLQGEDPSPLLNQVIKIPKSRLTVNEHRMHRLEALAVPPATPPHCPRLWRQPVTDPSSVAW